MSRYVKVGNSGYGQNEHILVAEKKLGRKIGKKEIVHHIDEDKSNNDPDNLMVLRTSGDHTRIHSKIPSEAIQTSDGSFVVIKKQRICPTCQRPFEPSNNRDVHCSMVCCLSSRNSGLPDRAALESLVKKLPAVAVGKHFGVSDVTISKWCKKLGIEKIDGRKLRSA